MRRQSCATVGKKACVNLRIPFLFTLESCRDRMIMRHKPNMYCLLGKHTFVKRCFPHFPMQIVDGLCRSNRGKHFFSTPFGVCFFIGVSICKGMTAGLHLSICWWIWSNTSLLINGNGQSIGMCRHIAHNAR